MTHEYVLLVGGTVIRAFDGEDASAIALAVDTVLAIGTDADVLAVSRGDSCVIDLDGATVIPIADGAEPTWPTQARLQVGGRASLAILGLDPRRSERAVLDPIAVIRDGHVVTGSLPGLR